MYEKSMHERSFKEKEKEREKVMQQEVLVDAKVSLLNTRQRDSSMPSFSSRDHVLTTPSSVSGTGTT